MTEAELKMIRVPGSRDGILRLLAEERRASILRSKKLWRKSLCQVIDGPPVVLGSIVEGFPQPSERSLWGTPITPVPDPVFRFKSLDDEGENPAFHNAVRLLENRLD